MFSNENVKHLILSPLTLVAEVIVAVETVVEAYHKGLAANIEEASLDGLVAKRLHLQMAEAAWGLQLAAEAAWGLRLAAEAAWGLQLAAEAAWGVQLAAEAAWGVRLAAEAAWGVRLAEEAAVGPQLAEAVRQQAEEAVGLQQLGEVAVGPQLLEEPELLVEVEVPEGLEVVILAVPPTQCLQ